MPFSSHDASSFHTVPVSPMRAIVVDAGVLGRKRHASYGLVQANVTAARQRTHEAGLSFSAYLVACLARAVAADPRVQAYRCCSLFGNKWKIFHDVDCVTMVEPEEGAVVVPHIIRKANLKSVQQISDEIRNIQRNPHRNEQSCRAYHIAARLPRWLRLLLWRWVTRTPERKRKVIGTVMLSSMGMFARGVGGWGLTFLSMHTLAVTAGGIQWQPAVVDGKVLPQEMLSLTLSFDHDIVDGAPAARFAARIVELVESCELLDRMETIDTTSGDVDNGTTTAETVETEEQPLLGDLDALT